jgi:hypothetical protein
MLNSCHIRHRHLDDAEILQVVRSIGNQSKNLFASLLFRASDKSSERPNNAQVSGEGRRSNGHQHNDLLMSRRVSSIAEQKYVLNPYRAGWKGMEALTAYAVIRPVSDFVADKCLAGKPIAIPVSHIVQANH